MTYVWTGLVCLLLLLLLTPWRARCSLTLSPRGGWGEAALFWGPFPLPPVPVRISLGDVPALSLELLLPGGSKTVFLAEMQRRRKKHVFMPPIRLESLEGTLFTGIRGDGAATALLTGLGYMLAKSLGEAFFARVRLRPEPCFEMNAAKLELRGILSLHPGETVFVYLKEKRREHAVR